MDNLPNEILIKILSYLQTIDLIQFLSAFEFFSYFLEERHVIKKVCFKKLYNMNSFDICNYITDKITLDYIKVLNVDGLYWISPDNLRNLISTLENMEELYALDTNIGLKPKDISLLGKLKKLSFSVVETNHFDEHLASDYCFHVFDGLEKLLVKVVKKDSFDKLYFFLGALKQLKELWIVDEDLKHGINYERIVSNLPHLNRFVIKSRKPMPFYDFSCFGLNRVYQNKPYDLTIEYIFDRISLVSEIEQKRKVDAANPVEQAWKTLQDLHADLPCGPKELKLEKLALSVEDNRFGYSTIVGGKSLVNLQSLCLKVTLKTENHTGASGFILFLNNLKSLKELWIFDEDCSHNRINYERIVLSLKNLNKFVLKSRTVLPLYDFSYIGMHKVFECKRTDSEVENIFEKLTKPEGHEFSIFEPKETELEKAWDTFATLHKDIPCGPKEGKLLFLKEDIKNIYFEDLNFCHSIVLCNSMYINAALQILASKNATQLKRLSTRSCLFRTSDNTQKTDKSEPAYELNVKRQRVGIRYDPDHPFRKIAQNIQGLIELEVYNCAGCHTGIYSAYFAISTFENLQKLTLEVPITIDGKFLNEVFIKCKRLYSLNIINRSSNGKFSIDLCNNLKHATALKDFRLDQSVIPIQKLLKGFNDIENKKLLRMVLKCEILQDSSLSDTFSEFMENNPQLIFFFMVISKNTIRSNSNIHETLNSFKKGNPAKIFYVKQEINSFSGIFPIPTAHHDLIFNRTNVSVINIDDF